MCFKVLSFYFLCVFLGYICLCFVFFLFSFYLYFLFIASIFNSLVLVFCLISPTTTILLVSMLPGIPYIENTAEQTFLYTFLTTTINSRKNLALKNPNQHGLLGMQSTLGLSLQSSRSI